jgi:hypothetical protein
MQDTSGMLMGGTEMTGESSVIRQANMVEVSMKDGMQNIQHIYLFLLFIMIDTSSNPYSILVCMRATLLLCGQWI